MQDALPSTATRNGKIARLPRQLRDEINRRLAEGEPGARLVEWLNSLPEAQAVLAADFGKRPISEQNLSEWRQGGFRDWQRLEETRGWMRTLAEEGKGLEEDAAGLAEKLTALALAGLGRLLLELPADAATAEQSRTLLAAAQRLAQLQRTQVAADRTRIQRERWEAEQAKAGEEKEELARHQATVARQMAVLFPNLDENGLPKPKPKLTPEEIAKMAEEKYPLRKPRCDRGFKRGPRRSNQIKPDQTTETPDTPEISSQAAEPEKRAEDPQTTPEADASISQISPIKSEQGDAAEPAAALVQSSEPAFAPSPPSCTS